MLDVVVEVVVVVDVVGGKFLDVYRRTLSSHFNFFINIFVSFTLNLNDTHFVT